MTDANTMKNAVAAVIKEQLGHLTPIVKGSKPQFNPAYNMIRQAILDTEQELRTLITGSETEQHEWLAVIHYALADERERLL